MLLQNGSSLALLPFFYSFFNIFIRKMLKIVAGNMNFVYLRWLLNIYYTLAVKNTNINFVFFARLYVYLLSADVNVGTY